MAYEQHGSGIHDIHVHPDDIDDHAAGYDEHLVDFEHDYTDDYGRYVHVGTYDLDNEHDNRVYRSAISRPAGVNPVAAFHFEPYGDFVVVHRRGR